MTAPVLLISLGGTIATTPQGPNDSLVPTLSSSSLIENVANPIDVPVRVETLATIPGASLDHAILTAALQRARRAVEVEGVSGVVISQGTDTLEEAAYWFDLLWDASAPLVLTAAMRSPGTPGFDGDANLAAALTVASASASRDRGVLVLMNSEVHVAAEVTKSHSTSVEAFRSPNMGPIGRVVARDVIYFCSYYRSPSLPNARADLTSVVWPRVATVSPGLGADPSALDMLNVDVIDGLVLASFGVGHVPERWLPGVERATLRMPVAFATSVGAGSVATSTYGFPGSEQSLIALGAFPAGYLSPRKARILMILTLASDMELRELRQEFATRGRVTDTQACTENQPLRG